MAAQDLQGTPAELRARRDHAAERPFAPTPTQEPATPASTVPLGYSPTRPNLRGSLAPGAAEEIHARHSRPSTVHLRGSLNNGSNEDSDSDILLSLAKQPVEQRLLALEQYVFEQHSRDLFSLNLKTRTLENKMSVVLAETDHVGKKAQKYDMSRLSSPQLTEEVSHGSGAKVAGKEAH